MSRVVRLLGAMALACAALPVFAVPIAHADTALITASNSGYFFALGVDKPDASPAAPPNVGNDVDGVGTGHLAVAANLGQETKVSFLYFDLFDLPADSTIEKAVVKVPLVPMSPPEDLSFQAAPANVAACMAGDQGFTGDDAVGIMKAPSRLCDKFKAVGTASSDGKAYEFNITALANGWLSGANDGVALTVADTAPSSNFQVVFAGPTEVTLAVTYAAPEGSVAEPPVTLPDGSAGGPIEGGVGTTPDLGGGIVTDPGTGLGSTPGVTVPPTSGNPPVTAGSGSTSIALAASSRPTNQFWLGGLSLVAALVVISLVCGDPRVAANQRKSSRLAKALSGRQGLVARPVTW